MTVWIASFPRSGNTLLRQVLHSGWGILSGSVYPHDLGDNSDLIRACGHVELAAGENNRRRVLLNPHNVMIKTHAGTPPDGPTIYIVRDGREACVSFWHFLNGECSLEEIVTGATFVGRWSDHVIEYADNANIALWLEYEELLANPAAAIAKLARSLAIRRA